MLELREALLIICSWKRVPISGYDSYNLVEIP